MESEDEEVITDNALNVVTDVDDMKLEIKELDDYASGTEMLAHPVERGYGSDSENVSDSDDEMEAVNVPTIDENYFLAKDGTKCKTRRLK